MTARLPVLLAVAAVLVAAGSRRPRSRRPGAAPSRPVPVSAFRARLGRTLERAALEGLVGDPVRAWTAALVLAAASGAVIGGTAGAAAGAGVAVVVPVVAVRARGDRDDRRVVLALPGALDAVAAALRAGSGVPAALAAAAGTTGPGPLGRDLEVVLTEVRSGVPVRDALGAWARRRPVPEVGLATAALSLAVTLGGPQAQTVDEVAAALRERRSLADELRVQASQARASALLVGSAPVAFAAVVTLVDRERGAGMLATPVGVGSVLAGLLLDLLGLLWMRRIVATAGATT